METLTPDVLKSNEIEGKFLDLQEVRSSIARHLRMGVPGLVYSNHHTNGVVQMMLDATQKYQKPLSKKRLFGWHSALFPYGKSGRKKRELRIRNVGYGIQLGSYRDGV